MERWTLLTRLSKVVRQASASVAANEMLRKTINSLALPKTFVQHLSTKYIQNICIYVSINKRKIYHNVNLKGE